MPSVENYRRRCISVSVSHNVLCSKQGAVVVHIEFVSFFSKRSTSMILLVLKKSFNHYETLDRVNALRRDSNSDYGNTGCRVFKRGGTKSKIFLPKYQHMYSKEIIEF